MARRASLFRVRRMRSTPWRRASSFMSRAVLVRLVPMAAWPESGKGAAFEVGSASYHGGRCATLVGSEINQSH